MLPEISPLVNDGAAVGPVKVPPPPRFYEPKYVTEARVTLPFHYNPAIAGLTSAQREGIRYEKRAQLYLGSLFDEFSYFASPDISYRDAAGFHRCFPDGILFDEDRTFIFEIKSQHMPEAWWQLRRLYEPLLRKALPGIVEFFVIEVCRSYDPSMPFPEPIILITDLRKYVAERSQAPGFGVFQWKP